MTSMGKGYLLVEGHGEVEAAGNLISRLSADLGSPMPWSRPIRWKNLHQKQGVQRGAELIRNKGDAAALLVLRDEDDLCPKLHGPEVAKWLRELDLPFPSAVVLLHPEYEVLFLPCLPLIRGQDLDGRPGLSPDAKWEHENWEAKRGLKEWLTRQFPPSRSYKPTLDQLPMTRRIDFSVLRAAAVPCFETLERALAYLNDRLGEGGVYP